MSLSTVVKQVLRVTDTGTVTDFLGSAEDDVNEDWSTSLGSGTGANQADKQFNHSYTIANGANQDLDLTALVNAFGATVNFARVKLIAIRLVTATAGYYINVGGGDDGSGNNAFINWVNHASDKIRVAAGGSLILMAPGAAAYVVTGGSADILRINNPNAASVFVEVVLVGASA